MKELEPHNLPISDKHEIENVVPDKREKLIVSLKKQRGHKLFELNLATRLINEVVLDGGIADFENWSVIHKHQVKDGCLYCTALNPQNADKKFFKMLKLKYPKKKK